MKIQSCDNCGVILDIDKLYFPDSKIYEREDGTLDESKVMWCGSAWRPFVPCPVCQNKIVDEPCLN
jgi:hypothetical protein